MTDVGGADSRGAAPKRTVAGWVHYLEAPDAQLTLSELMALCLVHIRENVKDARLGTQHLEGMLGTLDELLATVDPIYSALAAKRGQPVVPSESRGILPQGEQP